MNIAQLLNRERLTFSEVEEIARAAKIQRELPATSGDKNGEYWLSADVRNWARDAGHLLPSE